MTVELGVVAEGAAAEDTGEEVMDDDMDDRLVQLALMLLSEPLEGDTVFGGLPLVAVETTTVAVVAAAAVASLASDVADACSDMLSLSCLNLMKSR